MDLPKASRGVINEGGLHQLFIVAESITATKKSNQSQTQTSTQTRPKGDGAAPVTRMVGGWDLQGIRSIAMAPNGDCLALLTASMCPTIYGNEMIKAGLLLALFGGTPGSFSSNSGGTGGGGGANNNSMHVRSDIHVLMVGGKLGFHVCD